MVVLIIANMVLGLVAEDMRLSPDKLRLFLWHKSLGLTVLGLAILRLGWRWTSGRPELPPELPALERWAARLGHAGLYLMMVAMPLSGWALNSVSNVPLKLFGQLPVPALLPPDEALKAPLAELHEALFYVFATLVAVHAMAALKHHFVDRNDILRRMLPFFR